MSKILILYFRFLKKIQHSRSLRTVFLSKSLLFKQITRALARVIVFAGSLIEKSGTKKYGYIAGAFLLNILLTILFLSSLVGIIPKEEPEAPPSVKVVDVIFMENNICSFPTMEDFFAAKKELGGIIPWIHEEQLFWSVIRTEPREIPGGLPENQISANKTVLKKTLQKFRGAFAIYDGDTELIGLSAREDAEKVIALLIEEYIPVPGKEEEIQSLSYAFSRSPVVKKTLLPKEEIVSAEEAVSFLLKGTREEKNYIVEPSDTVWGISRKFEMTMAEIIKANPDIDPDYIYPGDVLNLIVPKPFFTLEAKYTKVYKRYVPFKTIVKYDENLYRTKYVVETAGKHGSEEVVETITTENGKIIEEKIVQTTLLTPPRTAVVTRGTHRTPEDILVASQILPSDLGIITSLFGPRWGRFHNGIDIGVPTGTPVYAYREGVVIFSGYSTRLGNMVIIEHSNGLLTRYGHFSKRLVTVGESVETGETIGLSGNTGFSTGPHVHFEIHKDNMLQDPLVFIQNATQTTILADETENLERETQTGGSR